MKDRFNLPAGMRRWHPLSSRTELVDGFELSLLDDCKNAYRFTATVSVDKLRDLFLDFTRFVPDEAFFVLEFYPEPQGSTDLDTNAAELEPAVFYSPYFQTDTLVDIITPFLERLIHDGFVGFGLANNRRGVEFFYSEEKVVTLFTDNYLHMSHFLHGHQILYRRKLVLPSEFGHDHLSLVRIPRHELPQSLATLRTDELDSAVFCHELTDILDMYQVEDGISFFLTRKEQQQIEALVNKHLPQHDFAEVEFGGLLLDWSDFVSECEHGFEGDLWEYRQGLLIRDTIQLVIEVAPPELSEKIEGIVAEPDKIFLASLTDRRKRLDAPNDILLRRERFWYQGMIRNQGSDLRRDLIRSGWFNHFS